MGRYLPGDVLLAPVALDDRSPPKARPVVVIRVAAPDTLSVCPVSSKVPSDAPCLPLALDDFANGGLDLFGESYVMIARIIAIRNNAVIGKRGRLTPEALAAISGRVPAGSGPFGRKTSGRQHR